MSTLNKRSPKWYGWLPDLPDHRDFSYSAIAPRLAALPTQVDLRKKCSPIENQGEIGACTANALVGALEFLELKDGVEFVDLSRLFVYYNERAIEGTVKQDSGAFLRDGIKSLAKQGVCPEQEWPYRVRDFTISRPQNVIRMRRHIRSLPTIASARSTKCGPVSPTDFRSCSGLPFTKRSSQPR